MDENEAVSRQSSGVSVEPRFFGTRGPKLYVASSWRNAFHPEVIRRLCGSGYQVYDFRSPTEGNSGFSWQEIDPDWLKWSVAELRTALEHPVARRGFAFDFGAMTAADACVLVLPCGRSAHLEAGYMAGAGKPVFIWAPIENVEPELMYGLLGPICVTWSEVMHHLARFAEGGQ